jgi:hypothetical protein
MTTRMQHLLARIDGGIELIPPASLLNTGTRHETATVARPRSKRPSERYRQQRQQMAVISGRVPLAIEATALEEPPEFLVEELLDQDRALLAAGF